MPNCISKNRTLIKQISIISKILDGGLIVPNAVLTADHAELIDIIRRHPLSSPQPFQGDFLHIYFIFYLLMV